MKLITLRLTDDNTVVLRREDFISAVEQNDDDVKRLHVYYTFGNSTSWYVCKTSMFELLEQLRDSEVELDEC